MNEEIEALGREIRRRRQALGMTLPALAEVTGITPNYIGAIELGHRDPSLSTVLRIARGLRLMPGELLGMPELPPRRDRGGEARLAAPRGRAQAPYDHLASPRSVGREAAVTLRLVKPAEPKPRRVRGHQLTDEEVKRVRAATRNLIRALGSVECLSVVTGLAVDTLYGIGNLRHGRPGMASAVKIAKAAGMPVEKLLSGRLGEAGACPTCSSSARRVA